MQYMILHGSAFFLALFGHFHCTLQENKLNLPRYSWPRVKICECGGQVSYR